MSTSEVVSYDPRSVRRARRIQARAAVAGARLLATQPPRRIRKVLGVLRRGARPATLDEARGARETVVAVSLACAGQEGCLPRSLGTVLLCRMHGSWATWAVGARRIPPFAAHAWVEAEGQAVGETVPPDYLRTFFTVS